MVYEKPVWTEEDNYLHKFQSFYNTSGAKYDILILSSELSRPGVFREISIEVLSLREQLDFNRGWVFIPADDSLDRIRRAPGKRINLPHTWNNQDGQDGGGDYVRGIRWYRKTFRTPVDLGMRRLFLEIQGANATAEVFLNGIFLLRHEGGFSTFRADLTNHLKSRNTLLISVDNGPNDRVYPQHADFTFFGGIYRNVALLLVEDSHFDLLNHGSQGVEVTAVPEKNQALVRVQTHPIHGVLGQTIQLRIFDREENQLIFQEQPISQTVFDVVIPSPRLWDGTKNPYLYSVEIHLMDGFRILDCVKTPFGVRTVRIDPDLGFFLNGTSYPLHGVSRHQDRLDRGWAIGEREQEEDMKLILETGANTVRLAHYQHNQYFYDLCDRHGIVVWAEIPFITSRLGEGGANTVSQMTELVSQNINHPSIVCWGLSNEITAMGESPEILAENQVLHDLCHRLDPSRLTTMAHIFTLPTDSPLLEVSDILGYNHYLGWYVGTVQDNGPWFDLFHQNHPEKCLGISEYGAEGILSWQNDDPKQGDYSETYQAYYHEKMLETFSTRPFLWGTYVWNMFDFAADSRDEGGRKGRNNKGLVTYDRKTKKDSFFIYKAWWSKDPFVHLCGKRFVDRTGKSTEVRVYSNQTRVALWVNGVFLEEQTGSHVFTFRIAIRSGINHVRAACESQSDQSVIRGVKTPNPRYILKHDHGINNWFEKDGVVRELQFPEGCFSIKDKIGDILAHPGGKAILISFLGKNPPPSSQEPESPMGEGLFGMMSHMSLEHLIHLAAKRFHTTTEQVFEVNEALNHIRK